LVTSCLGGNLRWLNSLDVELDLNTYGNTVYRKI